jgi:hypothetical protein
MYSASKLYEVLYVSTIAPNEAVNIVADIAGKSRTFNTEHDITGLLIFDGLRFCQQLEGNAKRVLTLMERIAQDPRHTKVELLHHAPLSERRFRSFSLGYSTVHDIDALGKLERLEGQPAVDAFMAMVPTVDIHA